ncbi:competence/damage-inducible protein A [Clostridium sp. D2Q-14]|uniref:competence/damage-inducible protein A n=1 Tax=Anaeromonas gelatinilytica TaxID=2683194 RepID=UPI00193BACD9|nr:competence/damage-inducible protein A [Anaeromonas gelatinilytica]MBS4535990.1 competence/damage-inducible protein A [Anaeromonas gelatinilytica]
MKITIISVGDEILAGDILNTNSQFISKTLNKIDMDISKIYTVKDDIDSIITTTNEALKESNVIIVTGGLGPTEDDKTREAIAKALDYKLTLDYNLLENLQEIFHKKNYIMSDNNIKQAYKIENSIIMENEIGTAPGMIINKNDKKIFLLPGPPKELQPMFNRYVLDYLKKFSHKKTFTKIIHTTEIGESLLEEKIKPYFNNKIKIGMYPRNGIVDIKISSTTNNLNESKNNVYEFLNSIDISEFIWGYDEDTLESVVFKLLKKHKLKIGFSESLTGGLISSNFTRLPGVSKVFPLSLITYSNESKHKLLEVKKETLYKYGAVSKKTAIEMSRNLVDKYNLDIGASVTGIAGPTGATKTKPIGLVYIGIADKYNSFSKTLYLKGNRKQIQDRTSLNTFNEIRKFLIKFY